MNAFEQNNSVYEVKHYSQEGTLRGLNKSMLMMKYIMQNSLAITILSYNRSLTRLYNCIGMRAIITMTLYRNVCLYNTLTKIKDILF